MGAGCGPLLGSNCSEVCPTAPQEVLASLEYASMQFPLEGRLDILCMGPRVGTLRDQKLSRRVGIL